MQMELVPMTPPFYMAWVTEKNNFFPKWDIEKSRMAIKQKEEGT